ncbi:dynamin family protein [Dictyobacter formicarum]|uniref:GTPase n=1 Tax=Dictyobacter formicarum TaxID=2778368 RepID=A0ABQ3V8T5_9CHLR|nr:dynamin family protein [Dictyobacter formicarum]GHO82249.1 GTPase [Dictyobacter formicarum]
MSETALQQRVDRLFESAIEETGQSHALKSMNRELRLAHERIKQPMRVAIVGLIKAGKSTLMNALLGETVVATGTVEATFNVNWLKYGQNPSLVVHFKDDRPPEPKSLDDLEQLTRRSDAYREYLLAIKYIEVFYPNKILHTMNLIDTPGLASFYGADSDNTRKFLELYGEDLTATTHQEAANADAVLYLFSHSIAAEDTLMLEMFQGPKMGHVNPINSIGVLTRVDAFWPQCDDALDGGQEIIASLQNDHPHLRRLFYSILPMCGLLAWGAQTLTNEEFTILLELAQISEGRFRRILRDAAMFTTREYDDVPISPILREAVLDRLGQYGIWQAYRILQSGVNDQETLTQALLRTSGLPMLKDLILSHFGNRAFLIKLDTALRQIEIACFWARQRESIQGQDREILKRVETGFGQLRDQEQGFYELSVLRDYYQGKLPLTENEVQHLLQVTGEHGLSDRQRLGLPEIEGELTESDLREMLARAREYAGYWRRRAIDPGASREVENASGVLGDAYDRISYQLLETMKLHGFTV